jgi:D-serine deaminase-like pyridoxal phosphate-dependent protein
MPERSHGAWKELLRGTSLPAAVVDLDAFDRNLDRLLELLPEGKTLRLASKSLRVPALLRRALGRSPRLRGLMCFSAREARWLAEQGVTDDLLLAYPTSEPDDLAAIRAVHDAGKAMRVVVDGSAGVARLRAALRGAAAPLPVLVDVDLALRLLGGRVHLGARRSPVRTPDEVVALAREIAAAGPELRFDGLLTYESQVAGLGDASPFHRLQNPVAARVRSRSAAAIAGWRAALRTALEAAGLPPRTYNGAGTGSFNLAAAEGALTELTAGSALLASHLFDYYRNIRFEPALWFALPVVRLPAPGYATCLGGGYVASGAAGPDRLPLPVSPPGARLLAAEGAGEVQTPVTLPAGLRLDLGDPVILRPAKAGELAERFDHYLLVAGDAVTGKAETYRGLGQCFF